MSLIPALLLLAATAAPPVEVSTLSGDQHVGNLERLTADEVVLKSPTGSQSIASKDLLSIRIVGKAEPPVAGPMAEVRLTDGSILRGTSYTASTSQAHIAHSRLGNLDLPVSAVQSVRFGTSAGAVLNAWTQLLQKTPKKDQVAIEKNDVLDHLDGVIGSLDDATLSFQLDGDNIPVKRARVYGLIYSKRESPTAKTTATVELVTGDTLSARTISWEGQSWKVKLPSGSELSFPTDAVQAVDFSMGKISYLSNMEPRDVKYTKYYDMVWPYRRDRSFEGASLRVGKKTYPKGLAIHSQTTLKYRLGGDYRQFHAIMAIDDDLRVNGNVDVAIKGDGRILFSGPVRLFTNPEDPSTLEPPRVLDLDVTGVVELEIHVGFGKDELDTADRLHLADAKLIK